MAAASAAKPQSPCFVSPDYVNYTPLLTKIAAQCVKLQLERSSAVKCLKVRRDSRASLQNTASARGNNFTRSCNPWMRLPPAMVAHVAASTQHGVQPRSRCHGSRHTRESVVTVGRCRTTEVTRPAMVPLEAQPCLPILGITLQIGQE